MPMLANVLLHTQGKNLLVAATDLSDEQDRAPDLVAEDEPSVLDSVRAELAAMMRPALRARRPSRALR